MARRFICLSLFFLLNACTANRAVELGQIPGAQVPNAQYAKQTVNYVTSGAKKEGQKVLTEGAEYKRVKSILDRLILGIGAPKGIWPLLVVDGADVINAAAVNQNTIVVYTGLIRRLEKDEELSVIIAHEIGHILAKHTRDKSRGTKSAFTVVLGRIAGVAAAVAVQQAGVGNSLANSIGGLTDGSTRMVGAGAMLAYDRSQEHEADEIGLMVMAKGNYNPKAAVTLYEKAEKVFGGTNSFSLLSTHPSASSRVKRIEKAMPHALKYYKSE